MKWLQRILGIEDIYNQVVEQNRYITGLRGELSNLKDLKREIALHNRALSRLIVKLDPIFAEDELFPERKATSDKLTDQVIRKLIGEHLANNMHTGDS